MEVSLQHDPEYPRPRLRVRATINLPRLPCGGEAFVDPRSQYIADCLRARYLVPVLDDLEPASGAADDP